MLGSMKTLIAALALNITTGTHGTIQLLPAGEFRAADGRPTECAHWLMNAEIAQTLIAAANAKTTPYVIDYEHQTLRAVTNGQPAPASGWFKTLEWRDGEGLFAVDVEWTETAASMIAQGEYRFISPVFTYDKAGRVQQLLHAALTNTPALDGMDEALLAAASLIATTSTQGTTAMEELLERLRWMLNLPITATADDITVELNKLIDQLSAGEGTAAASVDLVALWTQHGEQIAALSAQVATPDPAKWVSVDVMQAALQEAVDKANAGLADLSAQECEGLIQAALSDGRLLPAQTAWATGLAASSPESLKEFLNKAPKIAALTHSQTRGVPPVSTARAPSVTAGDEEVELDTAICSMMGLDPSDIAKFMQEKKHV